MIPIGSFLGGFIVKNYSARPAIILEGLAQLATAVFYLIMFLKRKRA